MKNITLEVPIQITDDLKHTFTEDYPEPENIDEMMHSFSKEDILKHFNTGLRQYTRNRVRANNNFGPLANKLFEMKLFPSTEVALDWILRSKGLK